MARIKVSDLECVQRDRPKRQSECAGSWSVYELDGQRCFQIDTFGRAERKYINKTSQTLQLERAEAIDLIRLMMKELRISAEEL